MRRRSTITNSPIFKPFNCCWVEILTSFSKLYSIRRDVEGLRNAVYIQHNSQPFELRLILKCFKEAFHFVGQTVVDLMCRLDVSTRYSYNTMKMSDHNLSDRFLSSTVVDLFIDRNDGMPIIYCSLHSLQIIFYLHVTLVDYCRRSLWLKFLTVVIFLVLLLKLHTIKLYVEYEA